MITDSATGPDLLTRIASWACRWLALGTWRDDGSERFDALRYVRWSLLLEVCGGPGGGLEDHACRGIDTPEPPPLVAGELVGKGPLAERYGHIYRDEADPGALRAAPPDHGKYPRIGVTSGEAENTPRLRVTYGEDSKGSEPPVKRRVEPHTASARPWYRVTAACAAAPRSRGWWPGNGAGSTGTSGRPCPGGRSWPGRTTTTGRRGST